MVQNVRNNAAFLADLLFGFGILIAGIVFLQQSIRKYYDQQILDKPPLVPASTFRNPSMLSIPIFIYHYVEYVKDKRDTTRQGLDVLPDVFEGHLQLLANTHYTTYFVKDIPDILKGVILFKPDSVVLTFDDGYEDFYTDAFPLLKKYNIKSTIYVVADFIGKKNYMTESQIREIVESNLVELGSHSMKHQKLTLMPINVARKEITDSKEKLEKRFNVKIQTFAYPYGTFSPKLIDLVKEASYSAGVSTVKGIDQSNNNLFFLSRVRAGTISKQGLIKAIEQLKSKEATSGGILTYEHYAN